MPTDPGSVRTRRRAVERWFVARGVPQLVEGYGSEPAMDARATPLIAAWFVAATLLFWGTRPDWSVALNAAGVVGTLLFIAVGWATVSWARGRALGERPPTYALTDIATFALLPAVPAAVVDGSVREAVLAAVGTLSALGVIYVIVGFGLVEIGRWALGRARLQLAGSVRLLGGTLPLVLIIVVFLLFASELWEAVHVLAPVELAAVLIVVLLVAIVLIIGAFASDLRGLERSMDWPAMLDEAAATPASALVDEARMGGPGVRRLRALERANLFALVLVNQLLPALLVSSAVCVTLIVFGLIVLPAAVLEAWIGAPLQSLATFPMLGEERTVSAELLTVSALISVIVGLYFTGQALTDPVYRDEHYGRTLREVRQLLAARAVYAAVVASERTVRLAS